MKRSLKNEQYWLYANLSGLIVFYLTLTWKTTESIDAVVTNLLFWVVIFWRLWQKRKQLNYKSDIVSIVFGLFLLALVLFKSISFFWFESLLFLPFTPFFTLISLFAVTFGITKIKQYWLELVLVGLLFMPSDALGWWFNQLFQIQILTAKFANYMLYYLGFNTISQGDTIILSLAPEKYYTAIVNYSCTGTSMIMLMFKLALSLESCVKMKRWQHFLFPTVAVIIGFLLGAIRVSIMTILLPKPDQFKYWHSTDGAQIFSTLAILIFSSFCYLSLNQQRKNSLNQNKLDYFAKTSVTTGKYK